MGMFVSEKYQWTCTSNKCFFERRSKHKKDWNYCLNCESIYQYNIN